MKEGTVERNKKIDKFLKKWDKMLSAAKEISDFKWEFEVTIHSDDSLIEDRSKTVDGINKSFLKHNMNYSSNYYLKN